MSEGSQPGHRLRVLVLDDDESQLDTLSALLEEEGFDVVACQTAAAGIERLGHRDVDVAVVDLRLPDADEVQLMDGLAELADDVAAIIHTGYSSYDSAKKAVNIGAFAYVEKGGDPSELLRQVHRAGHHRLHRRTDELESVIRERTIALSQSERRFRSIFAQTYQLAGIVNLDGTLTAVNNTALEFIGAAEADVVGRPFWNTPWWTHSPELMDWLREAISRSGKGEVLRREVTHVSARGELHYFDFSIKPVVDEDGVVEYLIPESRDITDRKLADEALRREKAFIDTAFNAIQDLFYVFDLNGKYLRWNKSVSDVTGYRDDEIVGMKPWDFFPDEDRQRVKDAFEKAVQQGRADLEAELVTKDGRRIPYEWTGALLKDSSGKVIGVCGCGRDITERKFAVQALKESESYHRSLLNSIQEDIVAVDRDYQITDFNSSASVTTGLDRDQLVGQRCFEVFHGYDEPCDRRGEQCGLVQVFSTGQSVNCHHRHLDSEGNRIDVDILQSPLRDSQGNVTHVIESMRDVSDLFDAHRAVEASEEKFRSLFNQAGDYIFVLEPTSEGSPVIVDANESACRIHGCRRDELIGRRITELDISLDEQRGREIARCMMAGETIIFEKVHRKSDGTTFPAEVSLSPVNVPGRPPFVISIERDLTERKRAEEALRTSELRFRTLFDGAPDAIFVADGETGMILDANVAASELLARPHDEIVGLHQSQLHPPHEEGPCRELFQQHVRQGGQSHPDECTVLRSDGREIPVEIRAQMSTIQGRPVLQGMFRDISERKQLEAQLRHTQKMDAVGQLAAGVAHDFRNQLTVIQGWGHMLQEELAYDQDRRDMVSEILAAAKRSATLTSHLLAFSRKGILRPEDLDIAQSLSALHKSLDRMIPDDIELLVVAGVESCRASVDPGQFEQAIINLVINACDAMPNGGRLTIEPCVVDVHESDLAHIPALQPGQFVEVTVSDTGTGMDDDTRSRIFEPFFTTKDVGKGTGLGLSMVYGFVSQSGGFVECRSRPGEGTQFALYFPATSQGPKKMESDVETETTFTGTETILVAEDEEPVRQLLIRILNDLGYTVLEASNGLEALQVADRHEGPIDLLITDVVMPKMGGVELSDRLRSIRSDLTVLYVSGYAGTELERRGLTEGGGAVVTKPFDRQRLCERVRELLDSR